jgi:hypothetical protein
MIAATTYERQLPNIGSIVAFSLDAEAFARHPSFHLKGGKNVQKQLSGGAVTGILVVVGIAVAILAWKVLAPPAAPPPVQITKEQMAAHAKSAAEISDQQKKNYEAAHGGSH